MEWQEWIPRLACQPHRARLRDPGGPPRPIEREPGRLPHFHVLYQLQHRLDAAARRRTARGAVAEALDDTRDPLAVEVLAGDDDDAAAAEVERGGQDAPVPERHHRLAAGRDDGVEMLQPLDAPAQ